MMLMLQVPECTAAPSGDDDEDFIGWLFYFERYHGHMGLLIDVIDLECNMKFLIVSFEALIFSATIQFDL